MGPRLLTRLAAPVAALSLLLLGGAGGAAWYVQRLQRNMSEALALNVASVRAAQELEVTLREVRFHLDGLLITKDARRLDEVPALRAKAARWLAEVDRLATTDTERGQVGRIRRGYARFFEEFDRASAESPGWRLPERVYDLMDTVLSEDVLVPSREYLELNEEALQRASDDNRRLAGRLVGGLLILGTCGAGAGLAAGAALAWSVRRSIVQFSVRLRDAAGPLNEVVGPVTVEDPGDLSDLDAAVGRLAGPIAEVVSRLQQSQREALRAEQLAMVGQMAAGVAHEVRNPLMAIKLLVQTAADRPGGRLEGRGLRVLEEEVGRLERLIRALLDFARPARPEKHPVRVRPAVGRVLELLKPRADLRGVRLEADMPAGAAFVEADSGQLHQLLFNLVQNAVEASPDGGRVRVTATAEAGRLAVRVADDGPGLPADLAGRIFEPFVSTKETGVGLGLSVCRRITEAHGWTLSAADRPGGGAEFVLAAPALPMETGGTGG